MQSHLQLVPLPVSIMEHVEGDGRWAPGARSPIHAGLTTTALPTMGVVRMREAQQIGAPLGTFGKTTKCMAVEN